ncbi:MAG: hypothetical protein WD046_12245 [Paracoccaceae bacterium]
MTEINEANVAALQRNRKIMAYSFWGVIIVLALFTIGLSMLAYSNSNSGATQQTNTNIYDPSTTVLQRLIESASGGALALTVESVEPLLDEIYAPVYASIPAYTAFHYSVEGEYTEIYQAVTSEMGEHIEAHLFEGFEDRLTVAANTLDTQFNTAFNDQLHQEIDASLPRSGSPTLLGQTTQTIRDDLISRAQFTAPIAGAVMAFTALGGAKTLSVFIAQKMLIKILAKLGIKTAAKGGAIVAGIGTGAGLCSWSGPGAAVCGAVGGLVAWFAADAAIVNIDQYFHADEFEAELRLLIDDSRAQTRALLLAALDVKARALSDATTTFHELAAPQN